MDVVLPTTTVHRAAAFLVLSIVLFWPLNRCITFGIPVCSCTEILAHISPTKAALLSNVCHPAFIACLSAAIRSSFIRLRSGSPFELHVVRTAHSAAKTADTHILCIPVHFHRMHLCAPQSIAIQFNAIQCHPMLSNAISSSVQQLTVTACSF